MDEHSIEKDIFDFKDEPDMNIQIKPNYYIHMGLISAQRALMAGVLKTNVNDGIIAYSIFIEHIETLCRAAKYISSEYDKNVEAYKKSDEFTNLESKSIAMAKMANKKLFYLMLEIFGRAPMSDPLKDNKDIISPI